MIDDCNINNLAKNQVSAEFSFPRKKCVTQIYRALYGGAIICAFRRGTNMAAVT